MLSATRTTRSTARPTRLTDQGGQPTAVMSAAAADGAPTAEPAVAAAAADEPPPPPPTRLQARAAAGASGTEPTTATSTAPLLTLLPGDPLHATTAHPGRLHAFPGGSGGRLTRSRTVVMEDAVEATTALPPEDPAAAGAGALKRGCGRAGGAGSRRGAGVSVSATITPEDDDDDLLGIEKVMKKMRVGSSMQEGAALATSTASSFAQPAVPSAVFDDFDDDADLEGLPRRYAPDPVAPLGPADDDASDYFPSDLDEAQDRSTPASHQRRRVRAATTVLRMAQHFHKVAPVPSANLFEPFQHRTDLDSVLLADPVLQLAMTTSATQTQAASKRTTRRSGETAVMSDTSYGGMVTAQNAGAVLVPAHWEARMRRYNNEEERWVEKGPVVLLILPCRPESPWEARVVGHYTFGTQSVAINMPISDVHDIFIKRRGHEIWLSSGGNNIVARALITQHPRRLRELVSPTDQKAMQHLMEVEGSSAVAGGSAGGNRDRERSRGKARDMMDDSDSETSSPEKQVPTASNQKTELFITQRVLPGPNAAHAEESKDYLFECHTQVVGVREESASVFKFTFESEDEAKRFKARFNSAVRDFGEFLLEQRIASFSTPQPVNRLLLSGQVVAAPSPKMQISPFAGRENLSREMAVSGLMYTPVIQDGCEEIQHRCVCSHCHAALAVTVPVDYGKSPAEDSKRPPRGRGRAALSSSPLSNPILPTIEELVQAHRKHPLATRWGPYDRKQAVWRVYRCRYGFAGEGGGLGEAAGAHSRPKRATWEVVAVGGGMESGKAE
ncbi:hypothetical protein DFJ73DRAFT_861929 [Zopfochytrium polystomum]|nr:hypothetical protein DFJ73DRAFT_861929 [Zopfochytrium polystomum]